MKEEGNQTEGFVVVHGRVVLFYFIVLQGPGLFFEKVE